MIKAIRKAHNAGWRAGKAWPRIVRIGGKRGVKGISEPLNPYRNTFTAPYGNMLLAAIWEAGQHNGTVERLNRGRLCNG